jgi:hypothetical protein
MPISNLKKQNVFVAVHENDPEISGGYTSLDGRSLAYVKELGNRYILTEEELKAIIKNSFEEGRMSFAYEAGDDTFGEDEKPSPTVAEYMKFLNR